MTQAPSVGRVVHFFHETWGLGGGNPPALAFVGSVSEPKTGDDVLVCALMVCDVGREPRWYEDVREGREYGEPGTWSWPPRT